MLVYLLVFVTGVAGLTWEILWFHHAGLALGVSAEGTALTFTAVMVGMAAGSILQARILARWPTLHPLRVYAVLELMVGLAGVWLGAGFDFLARMDRLVYAGAPSAAPAAHALGVMLLLGAPALAMGASMPVFAIFSERAGVSLPRMYAFHVAGASVGVLAASLWFVPALGIDITAGLTSSINVVVAAVAFLAVARWRGIDSVPVDRARSSGVALDLPFSRASWIGFATGLTTFILEVAWFRSLRAAYQATTESAALVLSAALIGLALGAHLAPWLRRRKLRLEIVLILAGIAVLTASPVVERFDMLVPKGGTSYLQFTLRRFGAVIAVLTPAFTLVGIGLPWLLDEDTHPQRVGRLYAVNTAGAVIGSVMAAWVLLPSIGAVRTGWIAGVVLFAVSVTVARGRLRAVAIGACTLGLAVAFLAESGVGRRRVQSDDPVQRNAKLLGVREGPDSTVSVVETEAGTRILVIDGFYTAGDAQGSHYMAWMGHLPMLMHPDPKRALVICFGTGQTADAVRDEGPAHLDIVDVNEAVLGMADHFPANDHVLDDPRVTATVMDGRAWLRRTDAAYDVVTLEPMPPTFAGSNALYSLEFYELIRARASEGAAVAQWLPFHLVTPHESASVAATFAAVFSDVWLWIDPVDHTGILLGRVRTRPAESDETDELDGGFWPGFARAPVARNLERAQIEGGLLYDPRVIARYAELGTIITDDNQLLSYGYGRLLAWGGGGDVTQSRRNRAILQRIAASVRTSEQ